MDKKLLDILRCPVCKGILYYDKAAVELICRVDRLAYPIRDDIPVMLEEEARELLQTKRSPSPDPPVLLAPNPEQEIAMPDSGFKVVIPARYGSSRLPGKPLLEIAGKPIIQYVYERACASAAGEVVVATDDARIADACNAFGADVALTRSDHRSGTDRIAEVIEVRGWPQDTIVVNLQGDEPCMPSGLIDQVARDLRGHGSAGIATLSFPIRETETLFDPHVVKLVTDAQGYALYFSRAPIPWHRDEFLGGRKTLPKGVEFLRHIGLYAYRAAFLKRFVAWLPAPLELAESLEQLRVLWHGEAIHVTRASQEPGPGVDTSSDVQRVVGFLGLCVD